MKKSVRHAASALAIALLVWGVLAAASAPAGRAPLRFAWVSDMHVGSDRGADDLRASVADINSQPGLSFVLVTGDITEMGSYGNLSQAKQILDGLRVPYHLIPGNHDTKWSESGGSDVARLWGVDRFVFESGGYRFIGLAQGPVLRMGDGNWSPQDVRWLDGLLAEKGGALKPTIFVSHFPLDPSISNWYVVLDKLKTIPTVAVLLQVVAKAAATVALSALPEAWEASIPVVVRATVAATTPGVTVRAGGYGGRLDRRRPGFDGAGRRRRRRAPGDDAR